MGVPKKQGAMDLRRSVILGVGGGMGGWRHRIKRGGGATRTLSTQQRGHRPAAHYETTRPQPSHPTAPKRLTRIRGLRKAVVHHVNALATACRESVETAHVGRLFGGD